MTVSTMSSADMASMSSAPPLASSLPPPPPPPDVTAATHPLSASQFRQQLLDTLHASGTLTSLKTQLKSTIIQQLIQRKLPALLASNNPPAAVQRPLVERLANSLILDYLLALSYTYTHSLFIAELGASSKEEVVYTQNDTLDLLHVDQSTAIGQQLIAALNQSAPVDHANKPSAPSVLLSLLSTLHTHTAPSTAEMAVQTESSLSDSLDQKLKAVDDELSNSMLYAHPSFSLALEQRMAKVQRETNERAQRDIEQQVSHYKQVELTDVRREEREKYQQQLRDMQQQLTAQHAQQLKEHKTRLEAAEVEYERKVRAADEERYVGRQRLMDEMDKCKTREAELQRLELLMKREVGVEAEVWKERNGRLEVQLSTLAEERRRLEERIIEEKRRVEEQLTAQVALKDEQLRSVREADEQLRAQYDKSLKDNLSLTQQLADTQRQHVALSSSSSLVAAAEARAAHLQQQLTDQQRAVEYEKSKHADEVKELLWTANVAVERERERGHAMLVKLSNEWKDAYDTLMAEYERGEAERERKVWRERSGGGRMERRPVGVGRRTAWDERREEEEESAPSQYDARLQTSSFSGGQREQQLGAYSVSSHQASSPFAAHTSLHTTSQSPAVLPTPSSQHHFSTAPPVAAPTTITITAPPVVFTSAAPAPTTTLATPAAAPALAASPASPATTVAASRFSSPTTLDSSLPSSADTPLFTPPPSASRPPFASPSSSLPFPPLYSPATPMTGWTEVSEEEERRRAVEAVERGREEAKRKEREEREGAARQQQQDEVDERRRQDREAAERRVREERETKLRQEEERRKQREQADREAVAAATEASDAAHEEEEQERAERQEREEIERAEQEEREEQAREEREDREREEREERELAEVRRLEEKREREERNERRRTDREEQRAEEERRRLEEEERQLQSSMTEEERREEEDREQRRKQQRQQEADQKAQQAAQQRSTPPAPQPAAIEEEEDYAEEQEEEDEAARKEREKKARMDEFLQRARERRDRERQAEREEAEKRRRVVEEAEERSLQVGVRKETEVDEDIVEDLEVETADEAYGADEFDAPSESAIADEVEVEAEDEIEEDIEL